MRDALLLHNPASGRRPGEGLAREVAAILSAGGADVELAATLRSGHAAELAEQAARDRAGAPWDLIVLGGDGTLNEALLGLHRAGALVPGGGGLRLAALPGGTTNVVSKSLGLPRHPLAAARALVTDRDRVVDVGLLRLQAVRRPFLLACGAGLDADAVARVHPGLKRWLGQAAYQIAAVFAAGRRDRGIVARLELPDGAIESHGCESVVCGASELYAGVLRLSRSARPDDGLLEVVLMPSTATLDLIRAAWAGRRFLEDAPGLRVVQARNVQLSALREVAVHVDAEPVGSLPAEVSVLPRCLRMRVP